MEEYPSQEQYQQQEQPSNPAGNSPVTHRDVHSPSPTINHPFPQSHPNPAAYAGFLKQHVVTSPPPQQYPNVVASPPPQQQVMGPTGPVYVSTVQVQPAQQTRHENPWGSSVFDCCNPAEKFFMALFCPCIVFGKTRARLRDPTLASYDTVNSDCAIWAATAMCGLSCIYQWVSRKEIRTRYTIKGDDAEDGVWTACCPSCALVQEEKEVEWRTGAKAPPTNGVAYVPQQQMQVPIQMQQQVQTPPQAQYQP